MIEQLYDWEQAGDELGQTPWDDLSRDEIDFEARLAWLLDRPAWRQRIRNLLREARVGEVDWSTSGVRYISFLEPPLWRLVRIGTRWEPAPSSRVMHGGFLIDGHDEPVFASRLTERGEALLRELAGDLSPEMRHFWGLNDF